MIPKIIHYCWFGKKDYPDRIKEYMKSWKILEDAGYQFMRWDESNCPFDENEFVKRAYSEGRLGFIGDYYRLKALYEYGGIYLDTDIVVAKPFDDLLDNHAFIGFLYDCLLETAVIGSERKGKYIENLIKMYEDGFYPDASSLLFGNDEKDVFSGNIWGPSNDSYTWATLKYYPDFILNNKKQILSDFVVFPSRFFDSGKIFGREYCMHMYTQAWITDGIKRENKLKSWIKKNPFTKKLVTIRRYFVKKRDMKKCVFYLYRNQIENRRLSYLHYK